MVKISFDIQVHVFHVLLMCAPLGRICNLVKLKNSDMILFPCFLSTQGA